MVEWDFCKTPQQRYERDSHFKALVDVMVGHIQYCNYTPSEMRDAAILASIISERMTIRKILVPQIPEAIEKCLAVLHEWEKKWLTEENEG